MKPLLHKGLMIIAVGMAAIGLSGCVYYPDYGYGYGYPSYVAPPVVSGNVVFGGGWGGGWDRGGWGDRGDWRH